MFTNMKNKSEKDFLQKELEFYTNLLAQHEKNKEKNFNLPCTSSFNTSMQKSYPTYSNHSSKSRGMFTFNKFHKAEFKTIKGKFSARNDYMRSYPKERNICSFQSSKTQQFVPIHNSLLSSKLMVPKHNVTAPVSAAKVTGLSKSEKSNYCTHNATMYDSKTLAISDTKVCNNISMNKEASSKTDLKALMSKEVSVKSDLKAFMNKEPIAKLDLKAVMVKKPTANSDSKALMNIEASTKSDSKDLMDKKATANPDSKDLMNKEASVKSDSKALVIKEAAANSDSKALKNKEDSGKSDSKALIDKEASSKLSSKISMNKKASIKSDSKALMGEIAAITEQLKIKSGNNNSSDKLRKFQYTFKKINNSVRREEKINFPSKTESFQDIKNSSNSSLCAKLNKVTAGVSPRCKTTPILPAGCKSNIQNVAIPKLQFIENSAHRQKGSSMHMVLLKKLNAVEKLLVNASTKHSAKVLNEAGKYPLKNKAKLNSSGNQRIVTFKSPKVPVSLHKSQLSTSVNSGLKRIVVNSKFLEKQNVKVNENMSTNNSLVRKSLRIVKFNQISKLKLLTSPKEAKHLSRASNLIKTQYKVVNKSHSLSPSSKNHNMTFKSMKKQNNLNVQKNSYRLVNNHKASSKLVKYPTSCSKKKFVKGNYQVVRNVFSPLKKAPYKNFKKHSPHLYRSVAKHKQNLTLNESCKLSESLLENVMKSPSESSGIDVDLLLELAAENQNKLQKSVIRRRLYKSKNTLVNSYSVQARTAKMIKTKYFNPYKKPYNSKNLLFVNKSFKGYRSNYAPSTSKNSKSSPHNLKNQKCHQKKIVNLGGEKFLIGSTGRTLRKLPNQSTKTGRISVHKIIFKGKPVIKTPSPVSKIIASRALNRSINQALLASTKKKMQKINRYCMFYNRFGRCNKGIKCSFVHDPSKIAVCTRFLRGTCKSDKCLFSHEINPGKMAICSFFLQNACTKDDCPYLHEKLSPDAELCKAFVQGYCPHGKECKKAHILICSKFLRGQCDKDKDCIFPHPMKKEKSINSKSSDDNQKKDEFQLETMLRYFESNPQESSTKGLVVPKIKSLPEQPAFISLTMDETS